MKDDGAFGLALLLAALAGWVDAAGFGTSPNLFLSFMSGNTTDLAASLTQQNWMRAKILGAVLGLFVTGVTFGEIVAPWGGRRGCAVILGLEAMFLACGAALHDPRINMTGPVPLYPVVFAMGLQNAAMHRTLGISIGLSYVTGTLVQIGRALAGLFGKRVEQRNLTKYLAMWLSLASGAAIGTWALSQSVFAVLSIAAAASGFLAIVTACSVPAPRRIETGR